MVLLEDGACGWDLGESWDQNLVLAIDPLPPSLTTQIEMKVRVESLFQTILTCFIHNIICEVF